MNTANIELFKNACAFSLTCRRWGNSRRGDIDKVECGSDKSRVKLVKQLIKSTELDIIKKFQGDVYAYCKARTMPSFVRKGLDLVKVSTVEDLDGYLRARVIDLRELVDDLIKAYPKQVEAASKPADKGGLGDQFDLRNYPKTDELPGLFKFEWDFLVFDAARDEDREKMDKKFAAAQEEILNALRVAFSELVNHAVDRLKVVPGEKVKTFQKTMLPNITEFIETFTFRNLMNDAKLEGLVMSAQRVLKGITTEELRESESVRANVANKFEEIKKTLDMMIVDKPGRRFDLENE